jgi:hypothetical protein
MLAFLFLAVDSNDDSSVDKAAAVGGATAGPRVLHPFPRTNNPVMMKFEASR